MLRWNLEPGRSIKEHVGLSRLPQHHDTHPISFNEESLEKTTKISSELQGPKLFLLFCHCSLGRP